MPSLLLESVIKNSDQKHILLLCLSRFVPISEKIPVLITCLPSLFSRAGTWKTSTYLPTILYSGGLLHIT